MRFLGVEKRNALAVAGHFVNDSGVSSSDKKIASAIESERPDVFRFCVEENLWLDIGADAIDFCIGKNGSVHAVLAVDCERVNFQAGQLGKDFGFRVLRECIDL